MRTDVNTLQGAEPNEDKPRIKMQLYKTEPCQNWAIYGVCRYGNLCKFAHGINEQRSRLRHPKYKTSLCKDFPLGKCTFGNRCNFAHTLDELRSSPPSGAITPQQQSQQILPQQPQQQVLVQTPVKMLPDGRLISSFTPMTTASSQGDDDSSAHSEARSLRRYQSMDTLRAGVPHAPVPAIIESVYHGTSDSMSPAFASPTQPLLHLQQGRGNVARRVSSLSQLPSLRTSAVPPASAYLQGIAGPSAILPYNPTSPLVHQSPVMSTPSPHEFDPPAAQLLSDTNTLATNEWLHYPPQYLQQQQQQHQRPMQRRPLTSSISMQTLPQFKNPVSWDAQPAAMPNTAASSLGAQHLHTISAQSSATLIESDVWTTNTYSTIQDTTPKPLESRFFPTPVEPHTTNNESLRAFPQSPYVSHRQLRRQQSTDDWILLRNAIDPISTSMWEPSLSPVAKNYHR
ncbi:hypothetical protein H4R24_003218 [Coemansia sp. RSA 988]|nr:hypothetical protein H4R24_003218 [Coemansia sp. RSA 988]